ncbi:hypothetical protein V6N13_061545 [Hibiscus sabdariffa]
MPFSSPPCREGNLLLWPSPLAWPGNRTQSPFDPFIYASGVAQDLPLGLCRDIDSSTQQFASRIDELEEMSTGNRIWKQRLVDIGTVTAQQAKDWGFSGVMLRGRAT